MVFLDLSYSLLIAAEGLMISVLGNIAWRHTPANPNVTAVYKEGQIGQESFLGNIWFSSVQTFQACLDDQDKAIYVNDHEETQRGDAHGEAGN